MKVKKFSTCKEHQLTTVLHLDVKGVPNVLIEITSLSATSYCPENTQEKHENKNTTKYFIKISIHQTLCDKVCQ